MGKVRNNLLKIALGVLGLNTFTACYGPGPRDYDVLRPFPVSGRVTDESGVPLQGVKVSRYGTPLAVTAEDGSFQAEIQLILDTYKDTVRLHFSDAEHAPQIQPVDVRDFESEAEKLEVVLHDKR